MPSGLAVIGNERRLALNSLVRVCNALIDFRNAYAG